MLNRHLTKPVHAALGAALVVLVAACSDVPSGPAQPLGGPLEMEQPVSRVADRPLMEPTTLSPRFGERRQRRVLHGADGQELVIESVVGTDGRPRESVVSRNGVFIMRINNQWVPGAGGRLDRQLVSVRAPDGAMRSFDSRDVTPAQLAAASGRLREEAERLAQTATGRIRRLETDLGGSGACDAEVKAANIATWQYVAAAGALILASSTGNPFAATGAYMVFLGTYANYEAKQVDLDKCIAKIGKTPTDEV